MSVSSVITSSMRTTEAPWTVSPNRYGAQAFSLLPEITFNNANLCCYLLLFRFLCQGAGIACWLEHWILDRKVVSSNPGRSGGRIFFSRVNFVCWLLFGVCSIPVLPQWHIKGPVHSAKSTGGRLHLNTHTPMTQRSQSGLTIPLSRYSLVTYPEMSSHATCQGTFSHSHLSSLSHCGLILA